MKTERFFMKNIAVLLVSVGVMMIFGLRAMAQSADHGVVVKQGFSTDSILLGDSFSLTMDIEKDLAQEIQIPDFKDNKLTPEIEITAPVSIDTIFRDGRKMKLRLTFPLTTFEAGDHKVAPLPILSQQANAMDTIVQGDTLRIFVKTFEIDTATMQIADIKHQIDTPLIFSEIRKYIVLGILALSLILIAIFLYKKYGYKLRKQGKASRKALIPPHIKAIDSLQELDSKKLWQSGKYKEYYSMLTDILRTYAQERWGVLAMEMTTPEIMEALKNNHGDRLKELLTTADLVKFAKYSPPLDECIDAMTTATAYVELTKPEETVAETVEVGNKPIPESSAISDKKNQEANLQHNVATEAKSIIEVNTADMKANPSNSDQDNIVEISTKKTDEKNTEQFQKTKSYEDQ